MSGTETPEERLLRIGAELTDKGISVPFWLLQEAISTTAMSHDDDEGTYSVESEPQAASDD